MSPERLTAEENTRRQPSSDIYAWAILCFIVGPVEFSSFLLLTLPPSAAHSEETL
jgi:hypothetical protein